MENIKNCTKELLKTFSIPIIIPVVTYLGTYFYWEFSNQDWLFLLIVRIISYNALALSWIILVPIILVYKKNKQKLSKLCFDIWLIIYLIPLIIFLWLYGLCFIEK